MRQVGIHTSYTRSTVFAAGNVPPQPFGRVYKPQSRSKLCEAIPAPL
jgi:hypothetical protein